MNIYYLNKKNRPEGPSSKVFGSPETFFQKGFWSPKATYFASLSRNIVFKSSKNIKLISVIILTVSLLLNIACTQYKPDKKKENPFEYDLTRLKKVDPALIKYSEVQQIKIDLKILKALAVDSNDNIYVCGDTTLLILKSNGQTISRIALDEPATCIAVGDDKQIYLGMTDHVEIYDSSGSRKSAWDRLNNRAIITSIALTSSDIDTDDVFVADAGNQVVLRYNTSGKLLRRIGEKDPGRDIPGLIVPSPYLDVAIGYEGYLWVVNPGRYSLENYTRDGTLRSSWKKASMSIEGFCGCCNPTHIAILSNGSFVTSEKGLPRVKILNQSGDLIAVVAGPEHFKEGTVGLDLAVDSTGRILVLDPSAGVVRIFKKKNS
jgi:hypothetical protein